MRKVVLTAVLASFGIFGGTVDRADALCKKVRTTCIAYYPGLYSFAPCGSGYLPYVYPCQYRFPKYCGRRKACWRGFLSCASTYPYGCGYGSCGGWGGSACGYGCGGFGGCGGDCGYCGSGSCGSGFCGGGYCGTGYCGGGCDSCSDGVAVGSDAGATVDGTFEAGGESIYDGPVPAPEPPAAPTDADATTTSHQQVGFRLTAAARRDGTAAYTRGLRSYWDGDMSAALAAFDAAAAAEPQNALYQYFRALSFYNLHGEDAAGDWLAQAIELERQSPIKNWGRRMERVQGAARLWVEAARRNAGLAR